MRLRDIFLEPKNLLMYAGSLVLLVMFLIGLFTATLIYQQTSGSQNYKNTFSVTGHGEVGITPDTAKIHVTFEESGKEEKKIKEDLNKNTNTFIGELKDLGIDKEDIKTQNYSVTPKYEYIEVEVESRRPPFNQEQVGFVVSQSINVTVRDLDLTPKVLDAANNNDPQYIHGPNFHIDKDEDYNELALEKAIKNAKKKATNRARVLGVSLGDMVGYHEGEHYPTPYRDVFAMNKVMSVEEADTSSGSVLPAGEQTIVKTVTLEYEIK